MTPCGKCAGPVPEPGLYVVERPDGPRDACSVACGSALDDASRSRVIPAATP